MIFSKLRKTLIKKKRLKKNWFGQNKKKKKENCIDFSNGRKGKKEKKGKKRMKQEQKE